MELKNLSLKELESLKGEIEAQINTIKSEQKEKDLKLVSAIEEYLDDSPTEYCTCIEYGYDKGKMVTVSIREALFAIAHSLKSCY